MIIHWQNFDSGFLFHGSISFAAEAFEKLLLPAPFAVSLSRGF
jgi:hypothetical protein